MQRHMPIGYQIINGKAEINPETAAIVKRVFQAYLDGTSTYRIAKELTAQGILNASHKPSWNHGSVGKILENQKYKGDEFYPQMIEPDVFESVQRKRQEKVETLGRVAQLNSFANQTVFSGKLYCGICGQPYRRYAEHSGQSGEMIRWKCKHYIQNNRVHCRNVFLTDEEIQCSFITVINWLIAEPEALELEQTPKAVLSNAVTKRLTSQLQEALESGAYNKEDMKRMIFARAKAQYGLAVIDSYEYQTEKLQAVIKNTPQQRAFDEDLFRQTIQRMVIQPSGILAFYLHNEKMLEIQTKKNQRKEERNHADNNEKEHFSYSG